MLDKMETLVSNTSIKNHSLHNNGYNNVGNLNDINSMTNDKVVSKNEIKPITIFNDDMSRRAVYVNELVAKFELENNILKLNNNKLPNETIIKKLIERAVHWCLVNGNSIFKYLYLI